jgi:hypothetical protein
VAISIAGQLHGCTFVTQFVRDDRQSATVFFQQGLQQSKGCLAVPALGDLTSRT